MADKNLGIVVCVDETSKAFKFRGTGTDATQFWVPKKMISLGPWQVGFQGSLVVHEWWVKAVQNRTKTAAVPSMHQKGLCCVCGRPYMEHPAPKPRNSNDVIYAGKYKALCDGCVYNIEKGVKTSRSNFHSEENWAAVQDIREEMGCWTGEDCYQEHLASCGTHMCKAKKQ